MIIHLVFTSWTTFDRINVRIGKFETFELTTATTYQHRKIVSFFGSRLLITRYIWNIFNLECTCIAHRYLSLDINECERRNGGCAQICENHEGKFKCKCRDGWILMKDRKSCRSMLHPLYSIYRDKFRLLTCRQLFLYQWQKLVNFWGFVDFICF